MENTELEIQGLILDKNTISEEDFIIGADELEIPENTNTKRFFYNQSTIKDSKPYNDTRWSCGLFGTMGVISDLTGYEFTKADKLEIQRLAVDKFGLKVPGGMYMSRAVDCLRNWYNLKFPNDKLITFRTTIGSDIFIDAITKKHSLVVWYKTSKEYYQDSQDDGKISKWDYPKNGGHLVRTNKFWVAKIDDNYFGSKKYNTYENEKLVELKDNSVFFPSAYLFLKDDKIKKDIRNNIDLNLAKEGYDLGLFNWIDPRKEVSRQETVVMIVRGVLLIIKLLNSIHNKKYTLKDLKK